MDVVIWASESLGAAGTSTLNDFVSPLGLLTAALAFWIGQNDQSVMEHLQSFNLPQFLDNSPSKATPWGNRTTRNAPPWDIPETKVTRSYDFTVQRGVVAPDGVNKSALLVNDQYPGPLIEANWGDWIQVTVHNEIHDPPEGTSIHWHGIPQNGTPCSALCVPHAGPTKFSFMSRKKHRLRLINPSSVGSPLLFSIDNHTMTIMANDFVPVEPYETTVVTIAAGQRTDVVVEATGSTGSSFWMRVRQPDLCNNVIQPFALAAVYYDGADPNAIPWSTSQPDFLQPLLEQCNNDPLQDTVPVFTIAATEKPDVTVAVNMSTSTNTQNQTIFEMNGIAFHGDYGDPILLQINGGKDSSNPQWNVFDFTGAQSIRIHWINSQPFNHPMHVHGQQMKVLAVGQGNWNGSIVRPSNPQRRDTQIVPANGYLVVELAANTPGVWPFHCHKSWHLSSGQLINVLFDRENLMRLKIPPAIANGCKDSKLSIPKHMPFVVRRTAAAGDERGFHRNLMFILNELKECMTSHILCGEGQQKPLPSRILDIGLSPGDTVILRQIPNVTERYACLSHCWGSNWNSEPPLITTSENVASHLQGIPETRLQREYQEAIVLCRELGVRYLWIDSLCIVQDDENEWAQEAAGMASTYENAFITLAAASSDKDAADPSADRFSSDQNIKVGKWRAGEVVYPVYTRRIKSHLDWTSRWILGSKRPDFSFTTKDDYPLLGRAWVYQERILSPRVLHFSKYELYWECREISKCQCEWVNSAVGKVTQKHLENEHALAVLLDAGTGRIDPQAERSTKIKGYDSIGQINVEFRWQSIVEEYSRLQLMYDKDRLPALSGLAKQMQYLSGDQYLAGIWASNLTQSLRWHMGFLEPLLPRSSTYIAPTWSWVSVKSPIMYGERVVGKEDQEFRDNVQQWRRDHSSDLLDARIITAHCTLSTSNPFGEVSSGSLLIEGVLEPGTMRWHSEVAKLYHTSADETPPPLASGEPKEDSTPYGAFAYKHLDGSDFTVEVPGLFTIASTPDYAYHVPDEHSVFADEKVVYLRLGVQDFHDDRVEFLVLRAIREQEDTFERIGYALLSIDSDRMTEKQRTTIKIV
ncbi:MAG: hypothetical protein M1820_001851 [Bogoriella megaspora]|nr:MAG: hypothetical protein M1820_001851 [Bogoriella megaspora]